MILLQEMGEDISFYLGAAYSFSTTDPSPSAKLHMALETAANIALWELSPQQPMCRHRWAQQMPLNSQSSAGGSLPPAAPSLLSPGPPWLLSVCGPLAFFPALLS